MPVGKYTKDEGYVPLQKRSISGLPTNGTARDICWPDGDHAGPLKKRQGET